MSGPSKARTPGPNVGRAWVAWVAPIFVTTEREGLPEECKQERKKNGENVSEPIVICDLCASSNYASNRTKEKKKSKRCLFGYKYHRNAVAGCFLAMLPHWNFVIQQTNNRYISHLLQ